MKFIIAVAVMCGAVLPSTLLATGVPVLIWGNDGVAGRLAVPLAGHTLQTDAFKRNYLDSIMPCKGCDGHNVVVFLREKLSMEDVTTFGDVYNLNGQGGSFSNLKSMMEKEDSLALSSVENVFGSFDHLKAQFSDNIHHLDSISDVEKIPFDKASRLILIQLEENLSLPLEKRLAANDEFVGAVMKILESKKVSYTALFTAKKSSTHDSEQNTLLASARHLLAAAGESDAIFVNETCFMMYYTNMNLTTTEVNTTGMVGKVIPIPSKPTADVKCDKESATVSLKYQVSGQSFTTLTVQFDIKKSKYQDWYTENMTLSRDSEEVKMDGSQLCGPLMFSYACGSAVFRNLLKKNTDNVFLSFSGFQAQTFALQDGKFGYANDCTPFFSHGILSGLIVTALLLAILAFGISLVASISTMDRFDDPKGTPLNINAQEKS